MQNQGENKNQSNYEAEARLSAKDTVIDNTYDEKFLANRSEGSIFPMKNDVTGKVHLYVKLGGVVYNVSTGLEYTDVHNSIETGTALNAYRAITAARTLDNTDYTVECTANSFTVTLPTAVGIQGRIYNIKNTGAGVITIDGAGSETIDGDLTQTLNTGDSIQIQSTNSNWIIL